MTLLNTFPPRDRSLTLKPPDFESQKIEDPREPFSPCTLFIFTPLSEVKPNWVFSLIWNNYFSCSTTTHIRFVYNPGLPLLPSLQPMAGNWVDDGSGISQWLHVSLFPITLRKHTGSDWLNIRHIFKFSIFLSTTSVVVEIFFYDRCHPFRTSLFPLRPRRHWLWGTITGDGPAVSCHATAQGGRPPSYGGTTLCCKNIGVNECVWSPQTFAIL